MAIELSAVAAGLPMAASFAVAGGFVALREGRRRTSLNAAMHELRRPLQALCLSLPPGADGGQPLASSLELTVAAVERLDREINGDRDGCEMASLRFRPIAEAAVDRWRATAADLRRPLDLQWSGGDATLRGDRVALAQALDNLISNGFRHGTGAVSVVAQVDAVALRLAVRDGGQGAATAGPRLPLGRLGGRSRHGHGLVIVRRTATRHGGDFQLCVTGTGTEARLVLPLGDERV